MIGEGYELYSSGMITIIEDDLGDLVHCSGSTDDLLIQSAIPHHAISDYLPELIRLTHNRLPSMPNPAGVCGLNPST
jgi:hypothetical protein